MSRSYKRWPAWAVMVVVLFLLLGVGANRASQPKTADERVQSISKQLACPTCNGESVADSRAPSSEQIKENIQRLVTEGQLTDREIIEQIDGNYVGGLSLVPNGTGFDSLAWILPVLAAAGGVIGLALAFARWKRRPGASGPSEADRALVSAALGRLGEDDEL